MPSEIKTCQNCKTAFVIEPADSAFYEKIHVPPPTFCPECRQQRRLAFRNERALYKRACDLCGASVVSRVSPDKPYPMYCQACWWGDRWDPLQYGKEYDFSKPFFEQCKALLLTVPHPALLSSNTVNSEWVNNETDDKNCYLNVGGHFNEDSAYNTYEFKSRDSFDNYWLLKSERCYGNVRCERGYRVHFSQECFDCRETILSYDCRNCVSVFGCAGLRNVQYCIFNKRCTKEAYQEFLKANALGSHRRLTELREKAYAVWRFVPHRERFVVKSKDVSGNYITESRDAQNCWDVEKADRCKNLYLAIGMKDSYDGSSIGWGELVYEGCHSGGLYNAKFFAYCFGAAANVEAVNSSHIEYCYTTPSCTNCFGCVNMSKSEYCILNKKYSKEAYDDLTAKMRKHMMDMPYTDAKGRVYRYGEFFPVEFSPFGYNETVAQEYFPLTRSEAMANGYAWSDYESQRTYEFSAYEIPDDIRDVGDDVTEKILKCEVSGKGYRIIPMELAFLRQEGIALPRRAPLQRHKDRMAQLLPRRLYARTCAKCNKGIQTPYDPTRPEIVYCEACYHQEIT